MTERAYAAMQSGAEELHATLLYFKENRQKLKGIFEVARKQATRASGDIDEAQLRCAFIQMVEN